MRHRFRLSTAFITCMLSAVGNVQAQDTAHLVLTQDLRIDGHANVLVAIDHLAVSRAGEIVVSQAQDRAIRFFSSAGAPIGSVGREGEGPGEFRAIARMGFVADTLWVHDGRLRRFTLISQAREVLRSVPAIGFARPAPADEARIPAFRTVYPQTLYPDGSVLASAHGADGPAAGDFDPRAVTYVRVARDGTITRVVTTWREGRSDFYTTVGGGAGGTFPFAIRPLHDVADDGSRSVLAMVSVEGQQSGMFRVITFDAVGDTIYSRRYPVDGVPIPRSVADSAIDARARVFANPDTQAEYRRQAYVPPIYPPLAGLVSGRDATLWIRLRDRDGRRPYMVLDSAGVVIATTDVPNNVEIRVADLSNVWAVETDEFDVQSIVRYRVARH